jgi:hypothetical protein
MIFSFNGERGRILQASYDGRTLHINSSSLADFDHPNLKHMAKVYACYMTNEPVGDTKNLTHDILTGNATTES